MASYSEILHDVLENLPADQLPNFIGELAKANAIALSRLSAPAPALQSNEKLLDIKSAAAIVGCSVHWLRRHELPCVRRIGKRVLFHSGELQKYIRQKR
jgi:hypothetical protein